MALENAEVLEQLKQQRESAVRQLEDMRNTIIKIDGAIDVLTQIEESKVETTEDE
jgi:hypothetical protein